MSSTYRKYKFTNAVERLKQLSHDKAHSLGSFLANHAAKDGTVYAGYPTLMKVCRTKDRKLIAAWLAELEGLKIIERHHRMNQCNEYRLLMDGIRKFSQPGYTTRKRGRFSAQLKPGTTGNSAEQLRPATLSTCKNITNTTTKDPETIRALKRKKFFNPLEFDEPITTPDGLIYYPEEIRPIAYFTFIDPRHPNHWFRQKVHSRAFFIKQFPRMLEYSPRITLSQQHGTLTKIALLATVRVTYHALRQKTLYIIIQLTIL